ncbi:MAG: 2,3-bisphosphoglycerate-dependent phosphoglycerate mutase [Armatimonadetes bacterium]|nr:2,3-bisphosphoglycerate-dependent phosphoglycerate mutase [Armatimonadota bacterium]MCK6631836.1 2,3-bisphosphoglycerate-dependent phosphoglycerate mutase [Fimbriimonadaceae bacterium]NOG39406.1 2,3-bisphosphoglycerate-dependent phosphoglycerate mutase [Armatimonadota bacterium]NUM39783.1 2,3-bisphosphoglycerate-dependent phosphoglycerate mutase [Armatimonadota bacterium]GIK33328.1 MAG: 2,3-bisphosphoglycerate-dependent phosphoglycerate mutase [Armatimonadota bacterium]
MPTLCLIRHGQSLWNLENRFTGWVDVPLTAQGEEEARQAALRIADIGFQVAYTSALARAQRTLEVILEANGWSLPVIRDQALNERHYGDLQGLNKDELRRQYGPEQVQIWRRSYDVAPPNGEALKDTAARTLPFFDRCILGDIRQGKNVLVVAHGNSNRSIVMKLDSLSGEEVVKLELATGLPLVYELEADGQVVSKRVLE